MRLRTALTHAAVLLTVLAGCGLGGNGGGTSGDKDGPPAGGWPQPDNGRVTDAMCQLLRPGDWRRAGHPLLIDMELEPQKSGADMGGNHLWCLSTPANSLKFELQPTAEAGKIYYGMLLADRKDRVASGDSDSMLEENLVEGVDESWFDFGLGVKRHQQLKDYQLTFRQGALVVTIELGAVDDSKEKDPRGTLAKLARLVWERLPDVGRTDTGITPSVHFAVTGTGKADITYTKPQGGSEDLKDATLPWEIQLPTADLGKAQQGFNLSATQKPSPDKPYGTAVNCQIAVNGVTVANQKGPGFAICTGFYKGK
jgi:hypothetical protein